MLAVALEEHGPPEVLAAKHRREPEARPGHVLVELRAAALNRRDTLIRAGAQAAYRFDLPLVLGSDGAGVRRDTREHVIILPSLHWGSSEMVAGARFRTLGGPDDGTYAELVAVPEENVFPRPRGMSWHEAAALPLAALTAYRALFVVGGLRRGERLVVLGAGSGVSLAAIQLALHAGARVAVTSSSPQKLHRARELGADVAVCYRRSDWTAELLAQTQGADVVLDSVGSTWPQALEALVDGGRLVSCGATGGGHVTLAVRDVFAPQKRILGSRMGSRKDFRALLDMVAQGAVIPIVDSVRPLDEAASAHARMEHGEHFGKVVLDIG